MTRTKLVLVVLLIWAAYWAALPWIDCARVMVSFGRGLEFCTFGFPDSLTAPRASWPNLVIGLVYLVAAALVASGRWRT